MGDNVFWDRFQMILAFVVCVSIGGISSCNIVSTNAVVELVKAGSDPIAANCAIHGSTGQEVTCNQASKKQ